MDNSSTSGRLPGASTPPGIPPPRTGSRSRHSPSWPGTAPGPPPRSPPRRTRPAWPPRLRTGADACVRYLDDQARVPALRPGPGRGLADRDRRHRGLSLVRTNFHQVSAGQGRHGRVRDGGVRARARAWWRCWAAWRSLYPRRSAICCQVAPAVRALAMSWCSRRSSSRRSAGMASRAASARRMAAALAGVNGILTSNSGIVSERVVRCRLGHGSFPRPAVTVAGGEAAAQQEVLAVGLFEGLAQGGGFLAVAALEVGELGGQRAHDAGRVIFPAWPAAGSSRFGRAVRWCSTRWRMPSLR